MRNSYRLLQLTNNTIAATAAATFLPLGIVTRQIKRDTTCTPTFNATTSANNAVYINEAGFYKINYTGFLTVAAAGNIVVALQINGVTATTATVTASGAGTFLVEITFVVRALSNCCSNPSNLPMLVQLQNTGIAITGGNSNLIIERVDSGC